ncbi:MFS transporter [Streptomyces sp. NPDC002514]|uniref:MFS transporter n=1 Tax=Streptomyces sp. NPDC001270 TaxID=3364554 RepID=UPI0036C02D4B
MAHTTGMRRVVSSASIGTIVDWYDFFLYGTASALVFPKLFFPSESPAIGTLLSFAVYATGFVARPLGGVLCGHYGDRLGRKRVLMITLMVMGLATTAIGLLPSYQAIGVTAPVLLVAIRLLQGLGAGGEWGGASLLTLEHTGRRHGFWGSFLSAAVYVGMLIGNLVFVILGGLMSQTQLLAWGWRIPFVLSVLIVFVGVFMRRRVSETPGVRADEGRGNPIPVPAARRPALTPAQHSGDLPDAYRPEHVFLHRLRLLPLLRHRKPRHRQPGHPHRPSGRCRSGGPAVPHVGTARRPCRLRQGHGLQPDCRCRRGVPSLPGPENHAERAHHRVHRSRHRGRERLQRRHPARLFRLAVRCQHPLQRHVDRTRGRHHHRGGLAPLIATWLLDVFGGWWAVAAWIVVTSLAGLVGVALVRDPRPDDGAGVPPIAPRSRRAVA